MGKLVVECLEKRVRVRRLAKAVYKSLNQKAFIRVELIFKDSENMHELNRQTRGVDSVTDVLSYPSLDGIKNEILTPEKCFTEMEGKYIFLGSIVLCEEKIKLQAEEYGHSIERETEYLILHGLLHLFGYDHMTDTDKKEMRDKEKEILSILHVGEEV